MPVKTSTADIEEEIRRKIRRDADIVPKLREFANEVAAYWKEIAPVSLAPTHSIGDGFTNSPGQYKADVRVGKDFFYNDGMPAIVVSDKNRMASWIEYGTHDRHQAGGTGTPEFAPRARTEAHFQEAGK
jgi:hypothetical protein